MINFEDSVLMLIWWYHHQTITQHDVYLHSAPSLWYPCLCPARSWTACRRCWAVPPSGSPPSTRTPGPGTSSSLGSSSKTGNWGQYLSRTYRCTCNTISPRKMANGDDPKIQLKLDYKQNTVKAAVSVFQNKESLLYEVPKPKFDRPKLLQNVNRIKNFLPKGSTINRYKQSYEDIIAWKEPARTVKYFVFYMFFVYYFNICWLPIFLFYILFINWKHKGSDDVKPRMKVNI